MEAGDKKVVGVVQDRKKLPKKDQDVEHNPNIVRKQK
jgi:hypothetical protein